MPLKTFEIKTSKFEVKVKAQNLTAIEIASIAMEIEIAINKMHFTVYLPNRGKLTLGTRIHIKDLILEE